MTLLTICQNIAKQVKSPVPISIIGSNVETTQQIYEAVRKGTKDVFKDFDWQILQKEHTFTSTASTESYSLPSDFDRIINTSFWDTTNNEFLISVSPSEWRYLKNSSTTPTISIEQYYRIRGGYVLILPTPDDSSTNYIFEYITNLIIEDTLANTYTDWQANDDVSILDEYLIELAGTWRTLKSLGKDYEEAQLDYQNYLNKLKATNGSDVTIAFSTTKINRYNHGKIAYPTIITP